MLQNQKLIIFILITSHIFFIQSDVNGIRCVGKKAVQETTEQIMARPKKIKKNYGAIKRKLKIHKFKRNQKRLSPKDKQNLVRALVTAKITRAPAKIALNIIAGTLNEVQLFPPDSMGAVGPTQFIICINGLIRTINKNTGVADGALNISTDQFFKSVCACNANVGTSDPRIRYDRLTKRWFIVMINTSDTRDRILVAVSTEATITKTTKWNFFFINTNIGQFFDQPTLGLDANALYVGGVPFDNNGELNSTVYVIQKKSILATGPIVFHEFQNLADATDYQGVDNDVATSKDGFLISSNNTQFGSLVIRKVFNAGSNNPTISGTFFLNVPMTQMPVPVDHKGNNHDGTNNPNLGKLDVNDDRLLMAQIRNNSLWTTQHVGVNNLGVCPNNPAEATRTAARWYEIDISKNQPVLKQSGTLFVKTPTNTKSAASYFYPSVMVSPNGHMILGCSRAGQNEFINTVFAERFATDTLGTLRAPQFYTNSQTSYNPPGDSFASDITRRWGDYSYTSLDPIDQMTMWTIQEYCNATNSWACRAAKLLAPPPATPIKVLPQAIPLNQKSINIKIRGDSVNSTAYCDPKNAINKLKIQIPGIVVNKIITVTPQEIIANVSTVNSKAGLKDITVINPDGQKAIGNKLVNIGNCLSNDLFLVLLNNKYG
ncbi:MAG: hypothetical protein P4L22_05555 [Candidatus Babeliales bacterium]|nr:hypothetical protein [Candidatus Babeliales bacterium]